MKKTVFIDGAAGTTGLRIHDRLADRTDIELLLLPEELRQEIPAEALLIAALLAAVIISFGIRALLRWLGARPRKPQRQGRPSLPGLGKHGRKRRKSKGNVRNGR